MGHYFLNKNRACRGFRCFINPNSMPALSHSTDHDGLAHIPRNPDSFLIYTIQCVLKVIVSSGIQDIGRYAANCSTECKSNMYGGTDQFQVSIRILYKSSVRMKGSGK